MNMSNHQDDSRPPPEAIPTVGNGVNSLECPFPAIGNDGNMLKNPFPTVGNEKTRYKSRFRPSESEKPGITGTGF